jgi:hypothetical protein
MTQLAEVVGCYEALRLHYCRREELSTHIVEARLGSRDPSPWTKSVSFKQLAAAFGDALRRIVKRISKLHTQDEVRTHGDVQDLLVR